MNRWARSKTLSTQTHPEDTHRLEPPALRTTWLLLKGREAQLREGTAAATTLEANLLEEKAVAVAAVEEAEGEEEMEDSRQEEEVIRASEGGGEGEAGEVINEAPRRITA